MGEEYPGTGETTVLCLLPCGLGRMGGQGGRLRVRFGAGVGQEDSQGCCGRVERGKEYFTFLDCEHYLLAFPELVLGVELKLPEDRTD